MGALTALANAEIENTMTDEEILNQLGEDEYYAILINYNTPGAGNPIERKIDVQEWWYWKNHTLPMGFSLFDSQIETRYRELAG